MNPSPQNQPRVIGKAGPLQVILPEGQLAFPEYTPTVLEKITSTLRTRFRQHNFLPNQAEVMTNIYKGQDGLFVFPTGGGKTWTFAVPSFAKHMEDGSLTIIISPLRALIRNQASQFTALGIATSYITGDMTPAEKKIEQERIAQGKMAFLIITPERLFMPSFANLLSNLKETQRVGRIVIDEAHCISEWGRSFRGAFGNGLSERLSVDGKRPQVVACTATATSQTVEDICDVLGFHGENHFKVVAPIDRPNLRYPVRFIYDLDDGIDYLVRQFLDKRKDIPSIVYCRTRSATEEVAQELLNNNILAAPYHAGLDDSTRQNTEQDFLTDQIQVIVATCAYGMGINKPNIRYIAHLGMPGSLTEYSQESGRAGRDGQRAECEILYSEADPYLQEKLMRISHPTVKELRQQYIRYNQQLEKILNRLTPAQRLNAEPIIFIPPDPNRDRFWDSRDSAIDALLMHYRIIDVEGFHRRLLVTLDQLESFLPAQEELNQAWDQRMQQISIITDVIERQRGPIAQRISIGEALIQHFTHNSLINDLGDRDYRSLVRIDINRINRVLLACNQSDYEMDELVSALKKGRDTIGGRCSSAASLGSLSRNHIEAIIDHACFMDYLRKYQRGSKIWISVAQKGIEQLREILDPSMHSSLGASASLKRFYERIGHFAERSTLLTIVEPWLRQNIQNVKSYDGYNRLLSDLRKYKMTLHGQKVNGAGIVSKFSRVRIDQVDNQDTHNFLSYLFPEEISTLVNKKFVY